MNTDEENEMTEEEEEEEELMRLIEDDERMGTNYSGFFPEHDVVYVDDDDRPVPF